MKLEDKIYITKLFDMYGKLLSKKQYDYLSLIINNDYGFSEIAEEINVSRQNVYDNYLKAVNKLYEYENCLKFLSKSNKIIDVLKQNASLETITKVKNILND